MSETEKPAPWSTEGKVSLVSFFLSKHSYQSSSPINRLKGMSMRKRTTKSGKMGEGMDNRRRMRQADEGRD